MAKSKKDSKINVDEFITAASLEENWGLILLGAKQIRGIVKVETNLGSFALKKVNQKPEKLNFIYEVQEHLWNSGFQNQSRWLVAKSGQSFVQALDGTYYFLNKWINGKESNLTKPDQLKAIMRLLATLHQSSLGFTPTTNAKKKTKWDNWDMKYESHIGKLTKVYSEVKLQPKSSLGTAFLETSEGIIKMAEAGKKLFNASAYMEVLNRALAEKGFVHGDIAYHNLICSTDGEMHVIDFDYCSQNLRIHDLDRFLRKVMLRCDWDTDLNHRLLQTYHDVYPLGEDELEILKSWMHLSKHYWRIVKGGVLTKRYTQKQTIDYLYNEAAALDKRKKYLNSFPTKL